MLFEIAPTAAHVDAERLRRLAAGFVFEGNTFQARDQDQADLVALIGDGGLTGWFSVSNEMVAMDTATLARFKQEMTAFRSRLRLAGRSIKDKILAGEKIASLKDGPLWGEKDDLNV